MWYNKFAMEKQKLKKLIKAKEKAAENPPKELKDLIMDLPKRRDGKTAQDILMEMRYGCSV